ncbi:MAG TPA: PilC/PilY family type IV pilus protein [Caldimonas sp.]
MKHVEPLSALRSARGVAVVLAMSLGAAQAAQTDIASTPIITTTAALVKPNIMLLMDASGSMGRTHMPDEVETQTRPTSVGYKSSQCNALYYNPAQQYFLPKRYDGTPFPTPSYTAAPYAGFGAYYLIPDVSTTDLSSAFVAYDAVTLEVAPPFPDTPQSAYYFVYTGAQTLTFATAPCTDNDTGATRAATGGGTWTKVNVSTLSAGEKDNFAIWYSYYRTRLSLIKSAASLAFAPLNDTKRVGFITVQPKTTPASPGINGVRFLAIGDFNSGQKNLWFSKLFSQRAGGASPAREGLARVGRYYGGMEDSINTDMPATGADDPIQYACQQNFTIMTTDGYWNGQTESSGPGLYGGGLQLDGVTQVGQQDGDPTCPLSDPFCPRPIWDGTSGSIHVVTNKANAYTDNVCSLATLYRQDFQTQRQVSNTTRDTTRTTMRTVQYFQAKTQALATTTQTTFTQTYDFKSTEQFAKRKEHWVEERWQVFQWQEQTTKVTQQHQLQTTQFAQQTFQTVEHKQQYHYTQEQWTTAKSQSVQATTQYIMEKDQYRLGIRQVYMHQYQTIEKIGADEIGVPLSGDCVPGPGIRCETNDVFPSQLVDPSTCTSGPAPSVGPGPGFLKTTCIDGPLAVAYGPIATCAPGFTGATSGNGWAETTCDRVVVGAPAAFNGTCTVGSSQGPSPDFFIFICTRPAANNTSVPVASCGASTPGVAPDWITTTCSQPPGPNNFAATPSLPCVVGSVTDGSFVTTTCAKPVDTNGFSAACVANPGTTPPYIKTTCTLQVLSNNPIASASCVPGTVGPVVTTCPKTAAGPFPAVSPIDVCVPGSSTGAPNYFETTCTNPAANNQTVFTTAAGCGPLGVTAGTSPTWITSNCTLPAGANNATVFADPAACVANPGTSPPYVNVTCSTTTTMAPVPVDSTTCPIGTTTGPGPGFIVNHCDKHPFSPPTPVASCTPVDSGPPDFVVTGCGFISTDTPIPPSCVPGPLPDEGVDKVTCIRNVTGPTQVPTCTAAAPVDPTYINVTCAGSTTTAPVAIDPAMCPVGTFLYPTYSLTCSVNPAGPYPAATPVASCTPGTDGSLITTTCTVGPLAVPLGPVAPCTVGTTLDAVTQVQTTCSKTDTGDVYVPTSACPASIPQSGTGPDLICTTTPILGTAVSSCAMGAVDPGPFFDTTTACNTTVTSPMADYSGVCTPGPTATPGEVVTCNLRSLGAPVADAGCVGGTNGGTGVVTQCTPTSGSGHKYSVVTTKTVTTTPFSGAIPSGPDNVVTTSSASTPVDGVCYATPQAFPATPPVDIAGCGAWPCTQITATAGGSQNSLADVSQYYYKTDLRPAMPNNVPSAGPNVEDDNAPHQHMTTFAIGLGVSGTLKFRNDYRSLSTVTGDFAEIRAGTKNWPLWPDPLLDYSNPDNYNDPKSIDDYWHTAVNGRGRYFSANNPTTVVQGLGDALAKIDSVLAAGAPIGTSTLQPVVGNNFAYATSYLSGSWDGDLQASTIDLATGTPSAAVWSAKALLGGRTFDSCDNRTIYVMRGSAALGNFTWNTDICPTGTPSGSLVTGLSAAEQAAFGPLNVSLLSQFPYMTDGTGATAAQQQEAQKPGKLVNFLRGQRGLEDFDTNSLTKLFRHREGVLGDIVDSQPVYVKEPFASYQDAYYAQFKANNVSRTAIVYVGANDGMLHAFYATLDPNPALKAGQEAWAVIPSAVLGNMYKLADENYKRDGHQFYVDGTPAVGDVCTGACGASTDWRTILVGGLNDGGKGYYALDVTDPSLPPTPLWEFNQNGAACPATPAAAVGNTADCNLGLSFGKPVITKLAGTWVVMVTSGYNNVNGASNGFDGGGFLYVLNAASGAIIYKIPTESTPGTNVGTSGTPSGLAQINNYVDNVVIDNTTLRVYGGDVLGNMWRFDFLPSPASTLLATAKDPSNNVEPITIRPELAELDGKPFVMFGTGRLLGASDVTDSHVQSVYGMRDTLATGGTLYPTPRTSFRPMQVNQAGSGAAAVRTIACTGSPGDCARTDGWVLDLAEAGERVNVEMKLVLGALVFASNVPEQVPCSIGGHSWFNQIDFRTGAPIPGATTSEYLSDSLNVGFTVLQLPPPAGVTNPTYTGVFRQGKATTVNKNITPPEPLPVGKRISWREIPQQ